MSDAPDGPTDRRVVAYVVEMVSTSLAVPRIIAAMHRRPDSNWSATARKRVRGVGMGEKYAPVGDTEEKRSRRAVRGAQR